VAAAASAHSLVAALGNCSAVGVTGLTLGGGYGPLNGQYGLAADNLLGAEVVLADGRRATIGPDEEPELFWAIRGGGGNFGVVTSLRVRLHETHHMLAGPVMYPLSEAEPVLRRYAAFAETMPDELSIPVGMTSGPDGQPVLMFLPLWNTDKQRGERFISDFLSLGTPRLAEVGPMTYSDMLTPFDAWVDAADRLPLGDPDAFTARVYAWRHRCDHPGGRSQNLALFDGQLAPFPRRGHAHSCRGDRFRRAPGTFHGGDHRRLEARRE
jgi:hypothetical protein